MDPLLWLIAAAVAAVVVFIVGKYRKAPQEDPQQGYMLTETCSLSTSWYGND